MAHSVANPQILVHLQPEGCELPLRDACRLLLDTSSTKDCVVDALHHLKTVSGARHEYLYLNITIRGVVRRTVVVERTVCTIYTIDKSSSKEVAYDRFDIRDRIPYPPECLVETLKFRSLPLASLLRMFKSITDIAPTYDLLEYQCILFASSLMAASRDIWPHTHHVGPLASEKSRTSIYLKVKPQIAKTVQALVEYYNAPSVNLSPSTKEMAASLRKELEERRLESEKGRQELEKGRQELEKGRQELERWRQELEKGRQELEKERQGRLAAEAKLAALGHAIQQA